MANQEPVCLHDLRTFTRRSAVDLGKTTFHFVSKTYCEDCQAFLFEKIQTPQKNGTHTVKMVVHDEVYRLLYTKAGRFVLLREAAAARGWDIPISWQSDGELDQTLEALRPN